METEYPSAWRYLYQRYVRRAADYRFPNVFDVLAQATTMASYSKLVADAKWLDVYLRPPVEAYSMVDLHRFSEITDIGYRHAMEQRTMLLRLLERDFIRG